MQSAHYTAGCFGEPRAGKEPWGFCAALGLVEEWSWGSLERGENKKVGMLEMDTLKK